MRRQHSAASPRGVNARSRDQDAVLILPPRRRGDNLHDGIAFPLRTISDHRPNRADGGFSSGPFTPGGLRGRRDTPGVHGMHGRFWNTWNQARLERCVRECPVVGRTVGVAACQR